jgi:TPR repeat protein
MWMLALVVISSGCRSRSSAAGDGRASASEADRLAAQCSSTHPGARLACDQLGGAYAKGTLGVAVDLPRAAQLYGKACDDGFELGCFNLAKLVVEGRGVPRDRARAAELFDHACASDFLVACYELGNLYRAGDETSPSSPIRAAEAYRRGCDAVGSGAVLSCRELAGCYRDGAGVGQDGSRAIALYERACNGGYSLACDDLGDLYAQGLGGVRTDRDKAVASYRLACKGGFDLGCRHADGLGAKP